MGLTKRHAIGGPTAVLELGGLRLLTDPTFDAPGSYPGGSTLVKTAPPALTADAVGPVDVVLLSHDEHADNLDVSGRAYLATSPLVLSTAGAVERVGGTTATVPTWESRDLPRPDGGVLTVTAVPAKHGPDWALVHTGDVTGFVLSGDGLPTVYVSGDNASLDVVREVADRCGPVDVAVLFAGGARIERLDAFLTLTSDDAAVAGHILGARYVVPLHVDSWEHFTLGPATLTPAFERMRLLDRLVPLSPGESVSL